MKALRFAFKWAAWIAFLAVATLAVILIAGTLFPENPSLFYLILCVVSGMLALLFKERPSKQDSVEEKPE